LELSTETEVKIKIGDVEGFLSSLGILNPRLLRERHFEDNHLFDFPDHKLNNARTLLRVRFAGEHCYLTYKGTPKADGIFKVREELEVTLGNGDEMIQILSRMGMSVSFRYQKYRREYELNGIQIAIDETPVGNYVELEGDEQGIIALAQAIGITEAQFIRLSYYGLYVEYCRNKGLSPQYMVF
jgi:adenylate cyclase class 2